MNKPDTSLTGNRPSGSILGMGSCYALGTFTDNFYKQCAILMAAGSVTWVQGVATVLFSLPFILFSAWGGAVADRAVKRHIVIGAKAVEFAALFFGAWMLVNQNWYGILAVIFLMATQSTFFSPAINGAIPETFEPERIPRVNSLIKLASTAAILAGVALAGIFLDFQPGGILPDIGVQGPLYGRWMAVYFVLAVALAGLITAFTVRSRPAPAGDKRPFPWSGPVQSVRHALEYRQDKHLMLVLLADSWFYGVAAVAIISISNLVIGLGYSKSVAGLMTAGLTVGVACGALMGGRFSVESWRYLLLPVGRAMSVMLALACLTPMLSAVTLLDLQVGGMSLVFTPQLFWLGICLFLAGFFGGMYIIPLESYIQVRPPADQKGKALGVSNFMSFAAMAVSGVAFQVLRFLPPSVNFLLYGLLTLAFLRLFIRPRLRELGEGSLQQAGSSSLGLVMRLLLSLRYSVDERGLETIAPPAENGNKGQGILVLPNHPALIDPILVYSRLAGLRLRPLADEGQMAGRLQRVVARLIRAVIIPDLSKTGRGGFKAAQKALDAIVEALRNGENVLLYPSGRVYRSAEEHIGGNGAVAQILAQLPDVRVVLVRTGGLWGSSFSYASGTVPYFLSRLARGAVTLLGNGLLFAPRRKVTMEFSEPVDMPRVHKMEINRYLETYYNQVESPAVFVRRFWWQNRQHYASAMLAQAGKDRSRSRSGHQDREYSPEVREAVYAVLRETASLPDDQTILPTQSLTADLFMDSLTVMETATALEDAFGHPVPSPQSLVTVEDCLRAAVGDLADDDAPDQSGAVPPAWFEGEKDSDAPRRTVGEAQTFVHAFLTLARRGPGLAVTGDRAGVRTRRDILTGMLALSRRFAELPGDRLGIMLPSAPAALAVWLAALHAGKVPVFINWTVGRRNLEHCLALSGITHVVTASPLVDQLRGNGVDLDDLPVEWVLADRIAATLNLVEKVRAAVLAAVHCSPVPFTLRARKVPETAAILFTSGSESNPKAVPLTHANIMRNAADVLDVLGVRNSDKLLAMLPPFHSFGLLVGLALPACAGVAAAFHPNPTESARLNGLVRDFQVTLFGATPTFLDGMLTKARGTNNLASLRYVFAGAEKCPDRVYRAFAEICPHASLCEGYGITECSPVVSVNRPKDAAAGSIGHLLPSVQGLVVREDGEGLPVARSAVGDTGMLLVRGPSIFSGYLAGPGETPPNPFVRFEDQEWYRTGDLVRQDADGRLWFQGRLKRFVKIGGEMISLPQMEDVLQEAFSARVPEEAQGRPFMAVEAAGDSEDAGQPELVAYTTLSLSIQDINQALRQARLGPLNTVRRVVHLEELPLLGSGKTDYRALRQYV